MLCDSVAQEIVEDLQAALAQFGEIASDLHKSRPTKRYEWSSHTGDFCAQSQLQREEILVKFRNDSGQAHD
jgi:hypothetical protein